MVEERVGLLPEPGRRHPVAVRLEPRPNLGAVRLRRVGAHAPARAPSFSLYFSFSFWAGFRSRARNCIRSGIRNCIRSRVRRLRNPAARRVPRGHVRRVLARLRYAPRAHVVDGRLPPREPGRLLAGEEEVEHRHDDLAARRLRQGARDVVERAVEVHALLNHGRHLPPARGRRAVAQKRPPVPAERAAARTGAHFSSPSATGVQECQYSLIQASASEARTRLPRVLPAGM